MANAKIISFVDSQVAQVLEQTALELEAAHAQNVHDIGFIALNLRHDIKVLNTLASRKTQRLAGLRSTGTQTIQPCAGNNAQAKTSTPGRRRQQAGKDVDQLKQGGATPKLSEGYLRQNHR